jgi:hypothetical protein
MEVVKEDGEWLGCTTEVAEENRVCPLFSTAPLTPISKAHNDDHSMVVDNSREFQSTHPSIWMYENRRDIHDSFNEDESVFLVNTSFSTVTNPSDLKVYLAKSIMEIKAICDHFDWDFESLSSGREKIQDLIDMSTIETKVADHTDSVAESGSDKKLEVHLPTSSLSVPANSVSSCPKALDEFDVKAIDLKFLALVDNFPMEVDQFVRFGGYNVICSATITIFEHSIRLYLMTLHSQQSARCLNRKSAGAQYAIPIMDQLNHLIKCLGNEAFEDFRRFNVVFAPISEDRLLHDAMCHINSTIAEGIYSAHLHSTLFTNKGKGYKSSTFNSSPIIQ